ncbi:hypothetical protein ACWEKU_12150 [Streptomyces californicus]
MENIITAAESTVPGTAAEQLLFTADWLTGGLALLGRAGLPRGQEEDNAEH